MRHSLWCGTSTWRQQRHWLTPYHQARRCCSPSAPTWMRHRSNTRGLVSRCFGTVVHRWYIVGTSLVHRWYIGGTSVVSDCISCIGSRGRHPLAGIALRWLYWYYGSPSFVPAGLAFYEPMPSQHTAVVGLLQRTNPPLTLRVVFACVCACACVRVPQVTRTSGLESIFTQENFSTANAHGPGGGARPRTTRTSGFYSAVGRQDSLLQAQPQPQSQDTNGLPAARTSGFYSVVSKQDAQPQMYVHDASVTPTACISGFYSIVGQPGATVSVQATPNSTSDAAVTSDYAQFGATGCSRAALQGGVVRHVPGTGQAVDEYVPSSDLWLRAHTRPPLPRGCVRNVGWVVKSCVHQPALHRCSTKACDC